MSPSIVPTPDYDAIERSYDAVQASRIPSDDHDLHPTSGDVYCAACGSHVPDYGYHNVYQCARRKVRRQRGADYQRGVMRPFFLIVTATTRHYGGPEEGGWWYDIRTNEEARRVFTFKQARAALAELREEYPDPRFGIGSCANRGEAEHRIVICADESEFPAESTDRPTYE